MSEYVAIERSQLTRVGESEKGERDVEEDEVIRLLARDVAVTLGHDQAYVVMEQANFARSWIVDDPVLFEETLITEVQQYFHDTFIDTSWPACPRHPNHPMWYGAGGYWRCERDQVAIAKLGELESPPHSSQQ
jgi:hypothetical protein